MSWNTTRADADDVAQLTAGVVRVPTATTVTKTMAGTGRTATRSTASTGAGRVSAAEKGQGGPGDQQRGHGQHEEEALDDEGQQ